MRPWVLTLRSLSENGHHRCGSFMWETGNRDLLEELEQNHHRPPPPQLLPGLLLQRLLSPNQRQVQHRPPHLLETRGPLWISVRLRRFLAFRLINRLRARKTARPAAMVTISSATYFHLLSARLATVRPAILPTCC